MERLTLEEEITHVMKVAVQLIMRKNDLKIINFWKN